MQVTAFLNSWILILDLTFLICICFTINGNQWFLFVNKNMIKNDGKENLQQLHNTEFTAIRVGLWKKCSENVVTALPSTTEAHWCNKIHLEGYYWLDIARGLVISSCVLAVLCVIFTIAAYWKTIFEKISLLITFIIGQYY